MASSGVLIIGKTIPYTPMSSTCFTIHWLSSRPFTGIRTNGVTRGATLPDSAISRRSSMNCSESRRSVRLKAECSNS